MQIQKYGGFYIGRFEAGTSDITFAGDKTLETPTGTSSWANENYTKDKVIGGKITTKPGEIPYYHSDYYTAVEMSNRMYTTNTVISGLMTGTMWDATMKYISKTSDYSDVKNTPWGNYNTDTGLTYEQGRGRYIVVNSSNGVESGSFATSDTTYHYGIRTTGFSDGARKNNIYDLAGNLNEWTQEMCFVANESVLIYMVRGGSFNFSSSNDSVAYRRGNWDGGAGTSLRISSCTLYKVALYPGSDTQKHTTWLMLVQYYNKGMRS